MALFARKVASPVGNDDVSKGTFSQILRSCDPEAYGQGEKEVFDETYRKAWKLNASQFSTSFSPYEHSMVVIVTQVLAHCQYSGIRLSCTMSMFVLRYLPLIIATP